MNDLPYEMIWEIMTNLNVKNIENLKTVNKTFYDITQNNNFWKQLLFDHYKMEIEVKNYKREYWGYYKYRKVYYFKCWFCRNIVHKNIKHLHNNWMCQDCLSKMKKILWFIFSYVAPIVLSLLMIYFIGSLIYFVYSYRKLLEKIKKTQVRLLVIDELLKNVYNRIEKLTSETFIVDKILKNVSNRLGI